MGFSLNNIYVQFVIYYKILDVCPMDWNNRCCKPSLSAAFSRGDGFDMIYFGVCEYGEVLDYKFKDKLYHRAQISSAQN